MFLSELNIVIPTTAIMTVGAIALVLGVSATDLVGQDDELRLSLGTPIENVTSGSDAGQSYALYLPSDYDRSAAPPVLILMDPRGRATTPLALFRRAAEEFGYVVLSSYGTLSDDVTAFDRNDQALNAMLVDAQARFLPTPPGSTWLDFRMRPWIQPGFNIDS